MRGSEVARQFWVRAPHEGEIRSAALDPPEGDEVLVHTRYSGISRGTEALVFRGEVPESEYDVMQAPYQEGRFPSPVKYGYASVGRIVGSASGLAHRLSGDLPVGDVFCLFPHQDRYCVPVGAVTLLPDGVPAERAVLAASMETALNAVWDGGPSVGDRVVVIGGGVIGMLIAWLCVRIPGTGVALVDVNPGREPMARALGIPFQTDPSPRGDADVVFHASGNPDGLRCGLDWAGVEGTIVEVSWYGTTSVPLPLGGGFHSRRLTLRSSQVGRVPAVRAPRWDCRRRIRLALELLREPALDVLITGESPFEELPRVLAELSRNPGDTLCHRIRYDRDTDEETPTPGAQP